MEILIVLWWVGMYLLGLNELALTLHFQLSLMILLQTQREVVQFLEFYWHTIWRNVSITPKENIDLSRKFRPVVVNKIKRKKDSQNIQQWCHAGKR